eukprot:357425-Chlamydomonas_euryale.AAC.4
MRACFSTQCTPGGACMGWLTTYRTPCMQWGQPGFVHGPEYAHAHLVVHQGLVEHRRGACATQSSACCATRAWPRHAPLPCHAFPTNATPRHALLPRLSTRRTTSSHLATPCCRAAPFHPTPHSVTPRHTLLPCHTFPANAALRSATPPHVTPRHTTFQRTTSHRTAATRCAVRMYPCTCATRHHHATPRHATPHRIFHQDGAVGMRDAPNAIRRPRARARLPADGDL